MFFSTFWTLLSFLITVCRCQQYYSMRELLMNTAPVPTNHVDLSRPVLLGTEMYSTHVPLHFMNHRVSTRSHNPGRILLQEESTRIKSIATVDTYGSMDFAKVPEKSGDVSYISPEGASVKLNYIADENGYQVDSSFSNEPPTFTVNGVRNDHLHSGGPSRSPVHHSLPVHTTPAHMHSNVRSYTETHSQDLAHHSKAVAAMIARMGPSAVDHAQRHQFQQSHFTSHHAPLPVSFHVHAPDHTGEMVIASHHQRLHTEHLNHAMHFMSSHTMVPNPSIYSTF